MSTATLEAARCRRARHFGYCGAVVVSESLDRDFIGFALSLAVGAMQPKAGFGPSSSGVSVLAVGNRRHFFLSTLCVGTRAMES